MAGNVRGAVRVAVVELDCRVGVPGGHDDAAEVVDGVVQREQCGLLPAPLGRGGREADVHLVGQFALGPQRAERVEVLLELSGHVAIASGGAKNHDVGPVDVVRSRLHDVGRGGGMRSPRLVGCNGGFRGEFADLAQAYLCAGCLCSRLGGFGHLVDAAGGGVVDDRNVDAHGVPFEGGGWLPVRIV